MHPSIGKVHLVGAGPGDPGLLTLRGRERLETADVVVYDALVGWKVLALARPGAKKINVGKRNSRHTLEQEAINALLVRWARKGKSVVRLKGGDPFVFGRGGEEAEFLAENDVPFEIVPGVSSLTAVPAYAGIPVTDRRHNSMLTVVTGHASKNHYGGPSVDWARVSPDGTLVVLMGMAQLKEILAELKRRKWPGSKPIACIRWGTTDRQQVVTGTLDNILRLLRNTRPKFSSPAVIVVGRVVGMADKIAWFNPKKARKQ